MRTLLLLMLPVLLSAAPARAADAVEARLRAWPGENGGGRILFEFAEPVRPEVRSGEGDQLTIRFDRPVSTDVVPVIRALPRLVMYGELATDGRSLSFRLREPVRIRPFVSNGPFVVELDPKTPPTAAEAAGAPPPAGPPALRVPVRSGIHAGFTRIVFDWPSATGYDVVQSAAGRIAVSFDRPARLELPARGRVRDLVETATQPGGNATAFIALPEGGYFKHHKVGSRVVVDLYRARAAAAPPAADAGHGQPPAAAAAPPPTRAARAETDAKEPARPVPKPARPTGGGAPPIPSEHPAAPVAWTAVAASPPEGAAARSAPIPVPKTAEPPALRVTRTDGGVEILFPMPGGSKAAIFRRGASVWVVFDRPAALDLTPIAADAIDLITRSEQIPVEAGAAFRLEAKSGFDPTVRRVDAGWLLQLGPQASAVDQALPMRPLPSDPAGARLVIPVEAPGAPVELRDPLVGDRLIAVPVAAAQVGIRQRRRFPELSLLPTAQGVAIVAASDELRVVARPDRVEITTPGGLLMQGGRLDEPEAGDPGGSQRGAAPAESTRLFDFATWVRRGRPYHESRQALEEAAARASDEGIVAARLDLARFYLARGFAEEALGELDLLEQTHPEVFERVSTRALRGAASLLADRIEEAERDLLQPGLQGREAVLWQGLVQARRERWAEAAALLRGGRRSVADYPDWLQQQFALAAAEAAIETGNLTLAEDWLGLLDAEAAKEPVRWRAAYLRGRLLASRGAAGAAKEVYDKVAAGPDRVAAVRARLARIALGLGDGSLEPEAAIEPLERLRFAWRGDRVELDILQQLADAYLAAGDWANGLATLRDAAAIFSGTEHARRLSERMGGVFARLFAEDKASTLPPIRALALYEDYRDLTPPGPDGDRILRGLASRLVALDLFEPAAGVLDDLVRNRLSGTARDEAVADLALVRLLDGKPEAALQALALAQPGSLSPLPPRHRHLRARALAGLKRYTEAEQALAGDDSPAAAAIRADLHWRTGEWGAAAADLRRLLDAGPAAEGRLTPEASRIVLKLGLALTLAGDRAGAQALAARFGEAMATGPDAAAFRLLTAGTAPVGDDLRKIAQTLSSVDDLRSQLRAYRASLEQSAPKATPKNPS